jgi:hypothetical protein
MSRPLRLEFAGALYHITSRGNTVFFKIVGTVYPNFVKRLLPVRFLYFPSLDLMKHMPQKTGVKSCILHDSLLVFQSAPPENGLALLQINHLQEELEHYYI